jgi:hypothetical protein
MRIHEPSRPYFFLLAILALVVTYHPSRAEASTEALLLRQGYNAVSAQIDSLVRLMSDVDPKALDASRLPAGGQHDLVPEGMRLVMIFWADDEARVWLNDFLVGETRLTPVEVEVPSLYLRDVNRIRAKCWDTDWVESGFLCGLYLRSQDGSLHPVVVSDETWETAQGNAQQIAYAHSLPDIPGTHVIWQPLIFGSFELTKTFGGGAISRAAQRATDINESAVAAQGKQMDYHTFVQSLAVLEGRREALAARLTEATSVSSAVPAYAGSGGKSLSLTLGKAGPLREAVSRPVSRAVRAWAERLPEQQKALLYPDRRALKGEGAANPALGEQIDGSTSDGERTRAYQPPEERSTSRPGQKAESVQDKEGVDGGGGDGDREGSSGMRGGGGGGGGAASRLGLLLPTLILAAYVGYVITKWQEFTGGGV